MAEGWPSGLRRTLESVWEKSLTGSNPVPSAISGRKHPSVDGFTGIASSSDFVQISGVATKSRVLDIA